MDFIYAAAIEADPDGGFLITFPDVPEAISSGASQATARTNGAEALGLALRGIVAMGRPLPVPTAHPQLVPIAVGASDALKLALIATFNASRITRSELARRLGKAENEVRRLLDPDHPSKLPAMASALAALGKNIVISLRDAA